MGSIVSDFLSRFGMMNGNPGNGQKNNRVRHKEPVTQLAAAKNLETPYLNARREWNERYGSYIAQKRAWQMMAIGSLALSAVLGMALVHSASQSKVQPFVVEVDKLGQAVAVRPADKAYTPDQRVIRAQIANFIANSRNVTPDPIVQKRWLDSVYAVSSSSATIFLNDFYKKSDPFAVARNSMVSADIQPPLPLSKDTWQVQWVETKRGLNGQTEGISRWQAIVNISLTTPTTAAQLLANPTGIIIEQISWTQQL